MAECRVADLEGTIIEQCREYDLPGDEAVLLQALIAWTNGDETDEEYRERQEGR